MVRAHPEEDGGQDLAWLALAPPRPPQGCPYVQGQSGSPSRTCQNCPGIGAENIMFWPQESWVASLPSTSQLPSPDWAVELIIAARDMDPLQPQCQARVHVALSLEVYQSGTERPRSAQALGGQHRHDSSTCGRAPWLACGQCGYCCHLCDSFWTSLRY